MCETDARFGLQLVESITHSVISLTILIISSSLTSLETNVVITDI